MPNFKVRQQIMMCNEENDKIIAEFIKIKIKDEINKRSNFAQWIIEQA